MIDRTRIHLILKNRRLKVFSVKQRALPKYRPYTHVIVTMKTMHAWLRNFGGRIQLLRHNNTASKISAI